MFKPKILVVDGYMYMQDRTVQLIQKTNSTVDIHAVSTPFEARELLAQGSTLEQGFCLLVTELFRRHRSMLSGLQLIRHISQELDENPSARLPNKVIIYSVHCTETNWQKLDQSVRNEIFYIHTLYNMDIKLVGKDTKDPTGKKFQIAVRETLQKIATGTLNAYHIPSL